VKPLRALLGDRRRAQRGSVLSGVLIITAFLAIISGALVTELSTHFLLSRALVNRVANEATVNSAMELALDQLQNTPLASGCPSFTNMPPVNGRQATVSYVSCWPSVRESTKFISIAPSAPFNIDGTHSVIPASGQDLYVVGDSNGNIYSYQFGHSSSIWSVNLHTSITGPPMAMQDAACGRGDGPCPDTGGAGGLNADITYLVPIVGGGSSGCSASFCVELLGQDVPDPPDVICFMAATARVISRPAAGVAYPGVAYFGDSGGTLYAYDATEFSCNNPFVQPINKTNPGSAIVAGPVVVRNGTRDEIYVVTSKGSTSQLLWYEYQQGPLSLTLKDTVTLPFSNPIGLAVESGAAAPRIVITFQNGGVAMVNTNGGDPTVAASKLLGASIGGAPYWCSCPAAGPQIGVAGLNGALYVLNTNMTVVASYQIPSASAIRTAPASDAVGQWYFGADDGYLYEVQQTPGQSMLVQVARYGAVGRVGSSVQVGGCPLGICIYVGSANSAYIVSLDARDTKMTACLSSAPPACSGDNPRLWAQVQIGSALSPQTVHVQGWSYYSP
jgi:hypothetical protein